MSFLEFGNCGLNDAVSEAANKNQFRQKLQQSSYFCENDIFRFFYALWYSISIKHILSQNNVVLSLNQNQIVILLALILFRCRELAEPIAATCSNTGY